MPPTSLPHLRLLRCHGLCAPNQRHCPRHAADRIAFQELSPAPLRRARLTDCCIDTWPAVQRDGEPLRRCRVIGSMGRPGPPGRGVNLRHRMNASSMGWGRRGGILSGRRRPLSVPSMRPSCTQAARNSASNDPPACPAWGGSNWTPCFRSTRNRQCFALEPSAEVAPSRRNSAS